MIKPTLPTWANKGQLAKLNDLAFTWFSLVKTWLNVAFLRLDELTCPVFILDLLAFERGITRYANEPLDLYRKRVKYAFINAKEAGTETGLKNIFSRLGLGEITIHQRTALYDWDVVVVEMSAEQLSTNEQLLLTLLNQYGRTCRRYTLETLSTLTVNVGAGSYAIQFNTGVCPQITV